MKNLNFIIFCVLFSSLLFGQNNFDQNDWATDLQITGDNITYFDVDYTVEGNSYLVYQQNQSPNYPIRICRTTDHGYSWSQIVEYTMPSPISQVNMVMKY